MLPIEGARRLTSRAIGQAGDDDPNVIIADFSGEVIVNWPKPVSADGFDGRFDSPRNAALEI